MLTANPYYNATIKKSLAAFGSCFNNIKIGRRASATNVVSDVERVPLAYGPKQRWLDRILQQPNLEETKVAIKVPRMSYELISIAYDTELKLNRLNRPTQPILGDVESLTYQYQSVPYKLGLQLNVYGRNQDDVLQIVEQILPEFQPEYSLSIIGLESPESITNVPITLTSIAPTDTFEGDMSSTKRAVIYTLDFIMRVRFAGPSTTGKVIKFTQAAMIPNMPGTGTDPIEYIHVSAIGSASNYTVQTSIDLTGF